MNYIIVRPDELNHYGVKGMKWGVRKALPFVGNTNRRQTTTDKDIASRRNKRLARAKKAAIIGGSIAVAGLAIYGGYKFKKVYNAKTLEKVNNYIRSNYGNHNTHFNSISDAKSNWYGDGRAMMRDIRGYSDSALNRSKSAQSKMAERAAKTNAQNDYLKSLANQSRNSNTYKVPIKEVPIKDIPKTSTNVVSQKTQSTPVKDVSKQLKKQYGNLDPVKDDYYDYMDSILKNFK